MYSVNYFPAVHSGSDMWTYYNPSVTRTDLNRVKALGFNGIRLILAATPTTFSMPTPSAAQLAHLTDFYAAALNIGINLHLTCLDMFGGDWGNISGAETWLEAIFGALKTVNPKLANIKILETHNEVFSGGNTSSWPAALVWVQYVTYKLRELAPGIPVTTSIPAAQGTENGGLGFYYKASHGTDWEPDWYDFHCYSWVTTNVENYLTTALAVVGNDTAKLRVGECNYNMAQGTQRQLQADVTQAVRHWCQQLGIAEPTPWILYDLESSYQFPGGQSMGLLNTKAVTNPLGQMYHSYPPGAQVPAP